MTFALLAVIAFVLYGFITMARKMDDQDDRIHELEKKLDPQGSGELRNDGERAVDLHERRYHLRDKT